jgi:hypothetical protein
MESDLAEMAGMKNRSEDTDRFTLLYCGRAHLALNEVD